VLSIPFFSTEWRHFVLWERAAVLAIGIGHLCGGLYSALRPAATRTDFDQSTDTGVQPLNTILRSQLDKLPPAQREIIDETFFDGRTRAQIVARRGISTSTYDNHLQAAYRALRTAMMEVVKTSKGADRPSWYDLVEVLNERHAAKQLRRKSREKGKRSTSQHERSTFTGEASPVAPERGTIPREGATSAASAAKSRGKRHKNRVARSAA